jgi:hypothetical protein
MSAVVRDVRDDGALLVHLNDVEATDAGTLGYLPPGATSLDALVPLAAEGSCYLAGAATFDPGVTAWETCDGRSRLVQFTEAGRRGTAGALVDATTIATAAAHESRQVLEVRSRSGLPGARGPQPQRPADRRALRLGQAHVPPRLRHRGRLPVLARLVGRADLESATWSGWSRTCCRASRPGRCT